MLWLSSSLDTFSFFISSPFSAFTSSKVCRVFHEGFRLECKITSYSRFSGLKSECKERGCETRFRRNVELGDVSKDSPETCFLSDAGDKDPPTRDKKSTRGKGLPAISPPHFLQ